MREVKFKAWHKKQKVTETWEYLHGRPLLLSEILCYPKNDWVIRQYTGLKDKNNTEIYEGDFVKYFGKWNKEGKVVEPDFEPHEIAWSMGGFWAIPLSSYLNSSAEDWKGVGHTSCEVIGNIYENPEIEENGRKMSRL